MGRAGREQWKPIDWADGCYEVSDLGRVRSVVQPGKSGRPFTGDVIVSAAIRRKGIQHVLYFRGQRVNVYVHDLVAAAFVPRPPKGSQVIHRDGDVRNNVATNLSWAKED